MLQNYLVVAFRSLRRHRGYAALNVAGLAVGMACVVLIGLYVADELSYDRFHPSADRIVRMGVDMVTEDEVGVNVSTQGVLGPALAADLPEVEHVVRLTGGGHVFRAGGRLFEEAGILYADAPLFQVFDGLRLLRGDPATALAAPGSLVLSETLARKYFGDADPVGRTLLEGERALTVTGVMADLPANSHLQFDGALALSTAEDPGWWFDNWFAVEFLTYVRLRDGADLAAFRAKLPALVERRAGAAMREAGQGLVLHAERLPDLHLRSDRGERTGSLPNLVALGVIALLVLVIACVNFTNLATARSVERAKEVGVRKALGAARGGLAVQFLVEAVVLSGLALAVALGLVALARPAFEALADKTFALRDLAPMLPALAALALGTGLLAGAYPALALSNFRPAAVLRGRFATGRRGVVLRQGLVVLQFTISVALLAGTAVVYTQVRFMQERDLGFDAGSGATQLLTLGFGGDEAVQARLDAVKQRLDAHPAVLGVASSLTTPVGNHPEAGGTLERPDGQARDFTVEAYLVDAAFVDVYGMRLVAGRKPGAETTSDSLSAYVLNEAAVRAAGYARPEDVLGRSASFWGMDGEVVGVVRDFHTRGLQEPVAPLALVATADYQSVLTLRVRTAGLPQTLRDLEAIWREVAPQRPFTYAFLDAAFGAQYEAERRFGRVFGLFAGLAILTACLGLFGLAAFTAQQRTKEIGIRKALGATAAGIVGLLTRDAVKPVAGGFVLAVPLVYVAMSRWLDGFAYRTEIGPGVFALAGLTALAVALLTVSGQALRAAAADPVKALRHE
jgi:putative ABC transport system permease protein